MEKKKKMAKEVLDGNKKQKDWGENEEISQKQRDKKQKRKENQRLCPGCPTSEQWGYQKKLTENTKKKT